MPSFLNEVDEVGNCKLLNSVKNQKLQIRSPANWQPNGGMSRMKRTGFYCQFINLLQIVDMKFVRQCARQRPSKAPLECHQQQNIPPSTQNPAQKPDPASTAHQIEVQTVEAEGKEEQQYLAQIVTYISQLPHNCAVPCDYFRIQPDITEHMRAVLMNWLVDVHMKYKLQPETLFIATHLIDLYLSKVVVTRTRLQLVGITALWVAAKYEQTYQVPKLHNLVFICDSTYSREEILCMQSHIVQVSQFNLLVETQLNYFHSIHRVAGFQAKDYYLCRYILEICLFNVHFKKFHPKLVACSVAYLVRKLRKQDICWSKDQEQLLGVGQQDFKQCARDVCLFWQQAQEVQTLNSLRVKFQSPHYKEVSKIKIGQAAKAPPIGQLRA